jgi:antitoxin (DNA-binding transcriptional repressor) of toxin-antitoxin stability system
MATTTTLNMHEAKTHLSRHVARLKPGDRIILCRRNLPVAEILPISEPSGEPRPMGLGEGLAEVPDSFYDPLPDDILEGFSGTGPDEL